METLHLLQEILFSVSLYFLLCTLPLHIFLIYFAIIKLISLLIHQLWKTDYWFIFVTACYHFLYQFPLPSINQTQFYTSFLVNNFPKLINFATFPWILSIFLKSVLSKRECCTLTEITTFLHKQIILHLSLNMYITMYGFEDNSVVFLTPIYFLIVHNNTAGMLSNVLVSVLYLCRYCHNITASWL